MKLEITDIKRTTEKAILVEILDMETLKKSEIWLPKSQIEFYHTYAGVQDVNSAYNRSEILAVEITSWIAKQKGLVN